jgi:ankyrin repeat protein
MTAVAKGNLEIVQILLRNNSLDLNVKDSYTGVNSFWLACFYGHGSIMNELANAGIDVNNCNKQGINSLHLSIFKNHKHITKMLLESNYNLLDETENGHTIIHLACLLSRTEIL